jgi:KDO2-lipid IV(A) lauroyltransferase
VASSGDGVWAPFFGRPAYTPTLAASLQRKTGAALRINQGVEDVVRRFPAQYMWSYNRYKRPAGAPDPDVPPTA